MKQKLLASDFMFGIRGVLPGVLRKRIMQARFDAFVEKHRSGIPKWLPGALTNMVYSHYEELGTDENLDRIEQLEMVLKIDLCHSSKAHEWICVLTRIERIHDEKARAELERRATVRAYLNILNGDSRELSELDAYCLKGNTTSFYNMLMDHYSLDFPLAANVARARNEEASIIEDLLVRQACLILEGYKETRESGALQGCRCCTWADWYAIILTERGSSFARAVDATGEDAWDRIIAHAIDHDLGLLAKNIAQAHRRNIVVLVRNTA